MMLRTVKLGEGESQQLERPESLDILRSSPVGVSSPEEMERARVELLPWLEEQVADLPFARERHGRKLQKRRLLAVGGAVCALAAGVLLVFLVSSEPKSSGLKQAEPVQAQDPSDRSEQFATLVSGSLRSDTMEILSGSKLRFRSRVATGAEEGAKLVASGVYQLELGRSSEVSLNPDSGESTCPNCRIRLHGGSATFSVSPRPKGSTFMVEAPDLTVTVVGTSFFVETRKQAPTCVRVSEGRVLVAREHESRTLAAGEHWGCEEGKPSPQGDKPRAEVIKRVKPSGTTLGEENALLSRALSAERKGEKARAQAAYRELLLRYPKSPFAQDARAGLSRLE